MDKSQHAFLKQLAEAPPSRVVPTIRSAKKKEWECMRQMCCDIMEGKIPQTTLPRETKKWFKGVANGRHKDIQAFRRSVTQRGGSKAELLGHALKAVAKVALPAVKKAALPMLKRGGKKLAQHVAKTALEEGSQTLIKKMTSSKKPTERITTNQNEEKPISVLTVDEILARKF